MRLWLDPSIGWSEAFDSTDLAQLHHVVTSCLAREPAQRPPMDALLPRLERVAPSAEETTRLTRALEESKLLADQIASTSTAFAEAHSEAHSEARFARWEGLLQAFVACNARKAAELRPCGKCAY